MGVFMFSLKEFTCRFPAGMTDKQLLQPSVDTLELGSDRQLQRSLSRFETHVLNIILKANRECHCHQVTVFSWSP